MSGRSTVTVFRTENFYDRALLKTSCVGDGCPDRCGQSGYFDKEGFDEAQNLQCPMEGCAYVWCKRCQREVVSNAEHSCDDGSGSLALPGRARPGEQKPLFRLQRGWTFGFLWSSIKTRVDVNASVQPRDVRMQLVSNSSYLIIINVLMQSTAVFRIFW